MTRLLLALAIDRILGEPPAALHPVVWLGRLIAWLETLALGRSPRAQLAYGAFVAALVPLLAGLCASACERMLARARPPLGDLGAAWLLKASFSLAPLERAASEVGSALDRSDLAGARSRLPTLVSRELSHLDSPLMAAAAVESLAENLGDSFVAPLCYYWWAGLSGAWAYRAANTLDAMWGYHGPYEWLGKPSARLDDLLNWGPARLSALLLIAAGWLRGADWVQAWIVLRRDRSLTASPNAGWPMSAMAGALGVELEKVGHYRLGEGGRPPTAESIAAANALVRSAAAIAVGLLVGARSLAPLLKRPTAMRRITLSAANILSPEEARHAARAQA